jgi:hypothetical protein
MTDLMNQNFSWLVLLSILMFNISCAGNTLEDDFATPSTANSHYIQCCTSAKILRKSAEKMLKELGFLKKGSNFNQAIIDFQLQKMFLEVREFKKIRGQLNEVTYFALLEKFQKHQAESIALISKAELKIGTEIYAIEKIKCEKYGQWVQLYKGTIKELYDSRAAIVLQKRYGFKHHPTKKGTSNTDWFCVPKQKYCYSEINFTAWQGKYQPNNIVEFPKADIFLIDIGIAAGTESILQKKCNR